MFFNPFIVPTEFSACIPYFQQILYLNDEVEILKEEVDKLKEIVETLSDNNE